MKETILSILRKSMSASFAKTDSRENDSLYFATLEALCFALDAADPYGGGHLEMVLLLSLALGRESGLDNMSMNALRAAALLHNIGRLGVPEHLYTRSDTLSTDEYDKLRSHPELGARILESIPFPWPVTEIVKHHSENWNGSGYPDGLRGEAIPIGARILNIAITYSALRRKRPYRDAYSLEEAVHTIEAGKGVQFDPVLVEKFAEALCKSGGSAHEADNDTPLAEGHENSVLHAISVARRESQILYEFTRALSGSLHLEKVVENILHYTQLLSSCDTCVLYLPEGSSEYLCAHGALGLNERFFYGSLARIGCYITGRVYERGEAAHASFLPADIQLWTVSDEWTPLRSTLSVPLPGGAGTCGVLNIYSSQPDAFSGETCRMLRSIASHAGKALEMANCFREYEQSAYTDALTELKNGRYLREFLEKEISRAVRDSQSFVLMNLDVDCFKQVNDTYGHSKGDELLRDIADVLRTHVRNYDLVARHGGDEFVIVLCHSSRSAAEGAAEKIKLGIDSLVARHRQQYEDFPKVGLSVGIAVYPENGTDLNLLLRYSDAAMYHDKRSRKNHRRAA